MKGFSWIWSLMLFSILFLVAVADVSAHGGAVRGRVVTRQRFFGGGHHGAAFAPVYAAPVFAAPVYAAPAVYSAPACGVSAAPVYAAPAAAPVYAAPGCAGFFPARGRSY
jgi:hypothetical protein